MSAAGGAVRRSESAARGFPLALWPLAAILLVAIVMQARFGPIGDVSWLITVDEAWLNGAKPYVDIIETNPPSALFLYLPATALAKASGLTPEFLVAASGFLAVLATIAFLVSILRRAGFAEILDPAMLGLALVAMTILPGRAFDERDFFAALLASPYVALAAARIVRAPIGAAHAAAAGLGLGAAIAIKPPYALVLVAVVPYLALRLRRDEIWRFVELYVAAALLMAFAGLVWLGFPDYLSQVMPTVVEVYAPVREPMATLALNAGVLFAALLIATLIVLARGAEESPLVVTLALAAVGALGAFFIQGKGWLYQAYPALCLLVLANGVALMRRGVTRPQLIACAAAAIAAAGATIALDRWPMQIAIASMAGAATIFRRVRPPLADADPSERAADFAMFGLASIVGVLTGVYCHPLGGEGDPALAKALRGLSPHPSIAVISEGLALGHPLTRDVGGVWAQRTQAMLMASAARYRISERPDDANLRRRMEAAIARDRDMLIEDIRKNRPDAILVGPLDTRFHAWAWADPALTAARSDYRFYAANDDPRWPAEIYVRKDLIGLRPGFSGDAQP